MRRKGRKKKECKDGEREVMEIWEERRPWRMDKKKVGRKMRYRKGEKR